MSSLHVSLGTSVEEITLFYTKILLSKINSKYWSALKIITSTEFRSERGKKKKESLKPRYWEPGQWVNQRDQRVQEDSFHPPAAFPSDITKHLGFLLFLPLFFFLPTNISKQCFQQGTNCLTPVSHASQTAPPHLWLVVLHEWKEQENAYYLLSFAIASTWQEPSHH